MKRILEIDGLRGIAILLVVSFHYINNQLHQSDHIIGIILSKVTGFGWVGVDLFFVLSGFLIGSILLSKKRSKNYFKTFYIRRIVRIVPNYYLLLFVFILILHSGYFDSNNFLTGNNSIPLWSYFLMVHNFLMADLGNLGNRSISITWSIGIEEQFYIVFPFILYKLKNGLLPWLLGLIVILAILSRIPNDHHWIPNYVLLTSRADALSFGIIIAWINLNYSIYQIATKHRYLLLILLFATILLCGILYANYSDLGILRHTFFSFIFSILVVLALGYNKNFYGKFLRNRQLRWIGRISYSLYLFHYLILGLLHHIFGQRDITIRNMSDVALTIIAFAISLTFSFLIYTYLEAPMIKIGKKYNY